MTGFARMTARRTLPMGVAATCAALCAITLAACAPTPLDDDDTESLALVESFLAHLEAGEAGAATALTDGHSSFAGPINDAGIDDDFYRASAALPSEARIVSTSGNDSSMFRATVEFVLLADDDPVELEVQVTTVDEERRILGSSVFESLVVGGHEGAGTLVINETLELPLTQQADLHLLPASYAGDYLDPSGLTYLLGQAAAFGTETAFTAVVPYQHDDGGMRLNVTPSLLPDVTVGALAAIAKLQEECVAAGFVSPSCPPGAIETIGETADLSGVTVTWFRDPEQIVYADGAYRITVAYVLELAGETLHHYDVTYSGALSRAADGSIIVTL